MNWLDSAERHAWSCEFSNGVKKHYSYVRDMM